VAGVVEFCQALEVRKELEAVTICAFGDSPHYLTDPAFVQGSIHEAKAEQLLRVALGLLGLAHGEFL
jgi:hypothetical protein